MDKNQKLQQAVRNNAEWSDLICQSHGVPGEFLDEIWINRHRTPPFYPKAITLSKSDVEKQLNCIRTLLENTDGEIGVKDSFSNLELGDLQFHPLFDAEWIYRSASSSLHQAETKNIRWAKILEIKELAAWEKSWNMAGDTQENIFLPSLLSYKDVAIFGAYQDSEIIGGIIGNKSADVVGLSNFFSPKREKREFWNASLNILSNEFPNFALVGYEGDESLKIALESGFESLGSLRVWIKDSTEANRESS